MRISNELQIGKAGEYFVCFDLAVKGFIAFPSDQGLPYDILMDTGKKLLRIQVKITTGPRIIPQRKKENKAYIFNIKKHGKNNTQRYGIDEVDLFALVALDTNQVGYITAEDMPETINIRCDSLKGNYHDEKGIQDYEKVRNLKDKMTLREIAKECNLNYSTVSRMCQDDYAPYKTNTRYFSDFIRDKDWFFNI